MAKRRQMSGGKTAEGQQNGGRQAAEVRRKDFRRGRKDNRTGAGKLQKCDARTVEVGRRTADGR